MKSTSKKLLLALYSPKENPNLVPITTWSLLVPEITAPGFRSVLHLLTKEGLIIIEKTDLGPCVKLGLHGKHIVESLFPALQPHWLTWQGEWSCMLFLQPPKSDPNFRYLRRLLIEHTAISLSRGAYLYPGEFPSRVLQESKLLYGNAIVIFKIASWEVGDQQLLLDRLIGLQTLKNGYSGVSRDVRTLIENCKNKKELTGKQKEQIALIYDRFYFLFNEDVGLAASSVSQEESPIAILSKWRELLILIGQK
ncbi:MAG TPA: hypothetical protein VD999_02030 [Vitreimonas sp.]|nr:hypothetical protein [Vitreimonas sp.]